MRCRSKGYAGSFVSMCRQIRSKGYRKPKIPIGKVIRTTTGLTENIRGIKYRWILLINTRIIIGHFGTGAYAQNGLLATFPSLMPFTDLGIGAVILNTVAGSEDLPRDAVVRRTLTTAVRVLLISSLVIATAGVVLGLLGAWPTLSLDRKSVE